MIRVGIIGPSRRHNGTGPFVARFLGLEGARVCAVCASTPESSRAAAYTLAAELRTEVQAFASVEEMVRACDLDAVAICSPAERHEAQIEIAVSAGLHVFCEKPLIVGAPDLVHRAATLVGAFGERSRLLHQNTQWTYLLDDLAVLLGRETLLNARSFEMSLCPPVPGLAMFWEAAPHAVSLLAALGCSGTVSDVQAYFEDRDHALTIAFMAWRDSGGPLAARVLLRAQAQQPRPASIAFDGRPVRREVLSLSPYRLALRSEERLHEIEDPLRRSIRRFVQSIERGGGEQDRGIVPQHRMLAALWLAVSTRAPGSATLRT